MSVQIYEMAESSGTTASGYWTANTMRIRGALLKHVFVDFGNTDCDFEFKLIDDKDRWLVYLNSCDTVLNRSYDLPVNGIYTIVVSNATADTQFKIRMAAQDVF